LHLDPFVEVECPLPQNFHESSTEKLGDDVAGEWMFIYWSGTVAAIIGMSYFGPK
jgi:hypothetical protein